MTWMHFVLKWTFFWQNASCLTKYGHRAFIFPYKIGKNGYAIDFFAVYFWQNWRFLDQIWAWQQGVFHVKFSKMKWQNCVSERMDVFWQNMGMRSGFLENRRFFTTFGHEGNGMVFFVKYGRKNFIFWNSWPIIYCSFARIDEFLTKYMHDSIGFFKKNLEKITWEHNVFERMNVFMTKYGHESCVFFREWTYFGI